MSSLEGQVIVIYGRLARLDSKDVKAQLKARGARVSGSVSSRTTLLITSARSGAKIEDAKKHGVPIRDEAYLERLLAQDGEPAAPQASSGAPLADYAARFVAMVAKLKAHDSVKVLNAHVGKPASATQLKKAARWFGGTLPADIESFFSQCDGLSLVWTDLGDPQLDHGIKATTKRLTVRSHQEIGERCGFRNVVFVPPIKDLFGPSPWIPVCEPGDSIRVVGQSTLFAPRVFDLVSYGAMAGIFRDPTRPEKPIQVVLGEDHGASWSDSIPGVSFADYMELVLATRGSIEARRHFMTSTDHWASRDLGAWWAEVERGLRLPPTPERLDQAREDLGDEGAFDAFLAALGYPDKKVRAHSAHVLASLDVDTSTRVEPLRATLRKVQTLGPDTLVAYRLIPAEKRSFDDLHFAVTSARYGATPAQIGAALAAGASDASHRVLETWFTQPLPAAPGFAPQPSRIEGRDRDEYAPIWEAYLAARA